MNSVVSTSICFQLCSTLCTALQMKTNTISTFVVIPLILDITNDFQYVHIARRSQSPSAWASYRKIKNEITKEIRTAHSNYQCQLFENDSNNISKKFWKYIQRLRKDHVGVLTLSSGGKQVTDSSFKQPVSLSIYK